MDEVAKGVNKMKLALWLAKGGLKEVHRGECIELEFEGKYLGSIIYYSDGHILIVSSAERLTSKKKEKTK